MITALILGLVAAAVILFIVHGRNQKLGGLPGGELIAADDAGEDCPVLVSHRYGITGRPDALVRSPEGAVIPVERKRARAPRRPYEGDLIQGIAYCILVEEEYGQAPPHVRIQYADHWFDEPYTPRRKAWALKTAERLRQATRGGACVRSHMVRAKCRNCGYRSHCDQAL